MTTITQTNIDTFKQSDDKGVFVILTEDFKDIGNDVEVKHFKSKEDAVSYIFDVLLGGLFELVLKDDGLSIDFHEGDRTSKREEVSIGSFIKSVKLPYKTIEELETSLLNNKRLEFEGITMSITNTLVVMDIEKDGKKQSIFVSPLLKRVVGDISKYKETKDNVYKFKNSTLTLKEFKA